MIKVQGDKDMLLKMQKEGCNFLYINNFNLNRGGVLKSNYTRIKDIHITGTKKYLDIYIPGNLVFLFEINQLWDVGRLL